MKNQIIAKYAKDKYINPKVHEKTPQEMLSPRVASNCEVNRTHVFRVKRQTVAIVFVPGIMGSRLEVEQTFRSSKRKEPKLWDPDDLVMMVKTFFSATPEERYELFLTNNAKSSQQPTQIINTIIKLRSMAGPDSPGVVMENSSAACTTGTPRSRRCWTCLFTLSDMIGSIPMNCQVSCCNNSSCNTSRLIRS